MRTGTMHALMGCRHEFSGELRLGNSRVLLVAVVPDGFGGLETHVLNLYKELSARGRKPLLLVVANSPLHQRVIQGGLTCYAVPHFNAPGSYRVLSFILTIVLAWLCKRHNIQLIHCNNRFELRSALRIARILPVKVILNHHVPDDLDLQLVKGISAFIAPSPGVVRYVDEENTRGNLGIKQTQLIPPMFDAAKFLDFQTRLGRDAWFAATFGLAIKSCPVISTIGNMVPDLEHKNYPLLFEAMAALIHDKRIAVQAVLVGDGPMRRFLENLTRSLDIENHVYFIGFTDEHTPGILYHSDVFVLASSREAFGIALLEAGLMCKPAIGARQTGAEVIIVHEKTGLLFENGSADSLADAIQILLTESLRAQEFGAQAYEHVMHHFAPSVVVQRYEELYAVLSRTT